MKKRLFASALALHRRCATIGGLSEIISMYVALVNVYKKRAYPLRIHPFTFMLHMEARVIRLRLSCLRAIVARTKYQAS